MEARKRLRNVLRIQPGASLGNGRDELAFPAPARPSTNPMGGFAGHMSPASSGRVVPPCDYDQEARRRAASDRDAIQEVARDEQTSREPSDAAVIRGFGSWGGHSRSSSFVKTESCYCEPVWESMIRRF